MTISRKLNKSITTTLLALLLISTFAGLISFASAAPVTLALTPSQGSPGAVVSVTAAASSFTAGETVRVYWGPTGTLVQTTNAGGDGSLSTTFNVPSTATSGTYAVTAVGATSQNSGTINFVVPTIAITLGSTTPIPGQTISVSGTGFTVSGLVRIYFGTTSVANVSASITGTLTTSNTITIPATTVPGTYVVTATDVSTGLQATQTCTVPSPTIVVNPLWGPSGFAGVALTGASFSNGGLIKVYFNGVEVTTTPSPLNADTAGAFTATFNVPNMLPNASSVVTVVDQSNGFSVASGFNVQTPTLTLYNAANDATKAFNSGSRTAFPGQTAYFNPVGDPLVSQNFTAGGTVEIYFGATSTTAVTTTPGTITATSTGSISGNFIIPVTTVPGSYVVRAKDVATGYQANFTLTVATPTLTLNPIGGPQGATVSVSGVKFAAGAALKVYWGANLTNTVATGTVASDGTFSGVTFTVPDVPTGAYTVTANYGTDYNATATFNVGPVIISLSSTSGYIGQKNVVYNGAGFTINGSVEVYWDSTLLATINASTTGTITGSFTVPAGLAGASNKHNVTAIDLGTGLVTPITAGVNQFTINTPTIAISSSSGFYPTTLTVTGANWANGSSVNIYFNEILVKNTLANSGDNGGTPGDIPRTTSPATTVTFVIPNILPGTYTIRATDGNNNATTTFTITGSGGLADIQAALNDIKATLAEYGSFYNFTNNWFVSIDAKLGVFTGEDTVASLLYSIEDKVSVSDLKFDFGGPQAAFQTDFIHITNATAFDDNGMWGWTDASGMQVRDRATTNFGERGFVFGPSSKTFQVALPDGSYAVTVTQGDANWGHDAMTIIANGELVSTQTSVLGGYSQASFKVTVEDGLLQLEFGKAAGATDPNWVVNGVTVIKVP